MAIAVEVRAQMAAVTPSESRLREWSSAQPALIGPQRRGCGDALAGQLP